MLQKLACLTQLEPCDTRALLTICVPRELRLKMVACRLLEIAVTAFCRICDKRLSPQFYAALGLTLGFHRVGPVLRSCSQSTSRLFGDAAVNGRSCPGLIGGLVRGSSQRLISEWPSANVMPPAPL